MKPQRHLREATKVELPQAQKETPQHLSNISLFRQYLTRGFQRMAEGSEKTIGNIPFPVFVWLMGVTIAAVYAFATLNATVQAMNNAIILRDAQMAREREEDNKRNSEARQALEAKIAEQQAYINQVRVEMARVGKGR